MSPRPPRSIQGDSERTDPLSRKPILGEVLRRVGEALLTISNGEPVLDRPIRGVTINDNAGRFAGEADHVVLAVGTDAGTAEAVALLSEAAAARCSAVVFRTDASVPLAVTSLADAEGVVVLTTPERTSWMHIASLLQVSVGAGSTDAIGGIALGDLFAFANALADATGGAVTLEDEQSRVLAYSHVGADVDEPRKQTILGRRVPEQFLKLLRTNGIWNRLTGTDEVVDIAALPAVGLTRRVATSIRAAGDLMGFIWVAETGHALAADTPELVRQASQTAALHIVRSRMSRQDDSQRRSELLRELLDGSASTGITTARLGLRPRERYAVVAFETPDEVQNSNRALQAVALYCSTFAPDTHTVDMAGRHYALVPRMDAADAIRAFSQSAAQHLESVLRRTVRVAFVPQATPVADLPAARLSVDRALNVAAQRPSSKSVVVSTDEVSAEAAILELLDIIRKRPHLSVGKLALVEDSARHRPQLEALLAYLDHFGDVRAAAATLNIHPNSFRYRMTRIVEDADIDLADPAERLMLQLQLRLLDLTGHAES